MGFSHFTFLFFRTHYTRVLLDYNVIIAIVSVNRNVEYEYIYTHRVLGKGNNKTPARRWGTPEDLMGPAIFLASEAFDFVNGQIVAHTNGTHELNLSFEYNYKDGDHIQIVECEGKYIVHAG